MKKLTRFLVLVFVACMVLPLGVFASTPYDTYTYSIDGNPLSSPDAYVPDQTVTFSDLGLETDFNNPLDIEADADGNVYIADTGNNRIIVTDKFFKLKYVISNFVNQHGVDDTFRSPQGIFVVDDGDYRGMYICDSLNKRLLVFDQDNGSFIREIDKPESQLFGEDAKYEPIACVVDKYGRIYVVSQSTTEGIIVMTKDGDFINFIGAPKVSVSAMDALIKAINPKAASELTYVPTTFSNLELDYATQEFLYATIIYTTSDAQQQVAALSSKSTDYAPVKLLNANGSDIMSRNGFFSPAGEIAVDLTATVYHKEGEDSVATGPSNVADVTSSQNGIWAIIDSKRSKIYCYDKDGNLLYAFGDKGSQLGNIATAQAITFQNSNLIVLDITERKLVVYRRTEYADLLDKAISLQNQRLYSEAVAVWEEVLARNNNFDTAYVEIGKALYREGSQESVELAIEKFKIAYDTENYATAFKEARKNVMSRWYVLLGVVAGVILLLVLLVKLFGYASKVNKATAVKKGERTFKEEFFFGFHLMFHPFDGYWDLKHEKRGSVRAGIVYVAITILAVYYKSIGTGYYYNPHGVTSTIFTAIGMVLAPLALFVIANWCFTTLFDGEGSLKDIFISSCYALFPMPLLIILSTVLTNVMVGDEGQITSIMVAVAYIWMALLLILGMGVTHDYSMGKNILTVIATIVGMIFILFILLLFVSLISKMTSFVSTIISEISYR